MRKVNSSVSRLGMIPLFLGLLLLNQSAFAIDAETKAMVDELKPAFDLMNSMAPMPVDDSTTMVNSSIDYSGVMIEYRLETLTNADIKSMGGLESFRTLVQETTCTAPDSAALLKGGLTFTYRYNDSGMNFVGDIVVRNSDC